MSDVFRHPFHASDPERALILLISQGLKPRFITGQLGSFQVFWPIKTDWTRRFGESMIPLESPTPQPGSRFDGSGHGFASQ